MPASVRRTVPRRLPRPIVAVTVLWTALLLGAGLLWPMTYGYDEPQHIDMAYAYSAEPFHFYAPTTFGQTTSSLAVQGMQPGWPPRTPLSLAQTQPRDQRPSLADLGGHTMVPGATPNQMVQHPPLYYEVMAGVLRLPGVDGLAWDLQVWLMRLVSSLFLVPIPLLCWAAARRLLGGVVRCRVGSDPVAGPDPLVDRTADLTAVRTLGAAALTAAVLALSIPNLVRDGASVNNDSLLFLAGSVVTWGLVRVLTGDLSRRTGGWIGAALAVALLTKGFGLVLPPAVLVAYLVGAWRSGDGRLLGRLRPALPAFALVVAGGVVGISWWVRNVVLYGTVQVSGLGEAGQLHYYGVPDNAGHLSTFLPTFLTQVASRVWGGVGLIDTPTLGPLITYGWLWLVVIGLLLACLVRGPKGSRVASVVLVGSILLTLAVVGAGALAVNRRWSLIVPAAQGRYVYHLVVALTAVTVSGWVRVLRPTAWAAMPLVVLVGGLATTVTAWVLVLEEWYSPLRGSGPGTLLGAVHSLLRWSPLTGPATVLLVLVLPAVTSALALLVLGRELRRAAHDLRSVDVTAGSAVSPAVAR